MKKISLLCLSLIILSTSTSCLKKQDLSDEKLGPAIEPMALTQSMGSGYGSYDFNEIKSNEFSSVLLTQRIQDSVSQSIQQEGITVQNSVNTVDTLKLDLIVQKEEYSSGQTAQSTKAWPLVFNKSAAAAINSTKLKAASDADSEPPTLMFLIFQNIAFGLCYDSGKNPETCHNLTSTDVKVRVPLTAASQLHCADNLNCYVPAKKIEFDRLQKTVLGADGKPRRTHITMILSPHVPFMSRLLQYCTRGVYSLISSNQQILADVCYSVNSYAFGQ